MLAYAEREPGRGCQWGGYWIKSGNHTLIKTRIRHALNTNKTQRMKLIDAIERCIESSADTNQTGITLSKTHGWRVTFTPQDREEGAKFIIDKESLNNWLNGYEWSEEAFSLCEEWIRKNIREWMDIDVDLDCLTSEEASELLKHV